MKLIQRLKNLWELSNYRVGESRVLGDLGETKKELVLKRDTAPKRRQATIVELNPVDYFPNAETDK